MTERYAWINRSLRFKFSESPQADSPGLSKPPFSAFQDGSLGERHARRRVSHENHPRDITLNPDGITDAFGADLRQPDSQLKPEPLYITQ